MRRDYYNEIDPFCAEWLRQLISQGDLPDGDVDTRDIRDVRPDDLRGYRHLHFFAGIGGWPLAMRRARWPDALPLWTGSCPCQPFSSAGQRKGFTDERHLWPAWHYFICELGPSDVVGEQVADAGGLTWLDLVQADLEGAGYACGPQDTCSAGVGAPNRRQRLYFAAERLDRAPGGGRQGLGQEPKHGLALQADEGSARGLAGADSGERERRPALARGNVVLGTNARRSQGDSDFTSHGVAGDLGEPGPTNGFWRDADWLRCRDERWRPVEPRTFPLASGIPGRVDLLRGYGNAINVEVAAGFLEDVLAHKGFILDADRSVRAPALSRPTCDFDV